MSLPAVELFSTSILSNHKIRNRHERYTTVFAIKSIPFIYHDLASDPDAKSRWQRNAKDAQIPGLLVSNQWVGSYDEFEDAIEFGELELFLGIDKPSPLPAPTTTTKHPAQLATSSKDPSLYPTLPYAPQGSGKRADLTQDMISSLGLTDTNLSESDVDALLASIGDSSVDSSTAAIASVTPKRYAPLTETATKPLRLARMGPSSPDPSVSSSPTFSLPSPRPTNIARYSTSQRSAKALAAEAASMVSNRKTSGALLREAVSKGKNLDEAMQESKMADIVSQENLDNLFASLGLKDVDLSEFEVDTFLDKGDVPAGLTSGGDRLGKSATPADKARDEMAARHVAQKAREKGYGSKTNSTTHTREQSLATVGSVTSGVKESPETTATPQAGLVENDPKLEPPSIDVDQAPQEPSPSHTIVEPVSDAMDAASKQSAGISTVDETGVSSAEATLPDKRVESSLATSSSIDTLPADQHQQQQEEEEEEEVLPTLASQATIKESSAGLPSDSNTASAEIRSEPEEPTSTAAATEDSQIRNAEPIDVVVAVEIDEPEKSPATDPHPADKPPVASALSEEASVAKQAETSDKTEVATDEATQTSTASDTANLPLDEKDLNMNVEEAPKTEDGKVESGPPDPLDGIEPKKQAEEAAQTLPSNDVETDANLAIAKPTADDNHVSSSSPTFQPSSLGLTMSTSSKSPLQKVSTLSPRSPTSIPLPLSPLLLHQSNFPELVKPSPSEASGSAHPSSSPNVSPTVEFDGIRTRKAMDVQRPMEYSSLLTSPLVSKKKLMSIKSFSIGKDKDKEKEKEKDKTQEPSTSPTAAAAATRHQRTISQILRDADAAMQLDSNLSGDEDEDGKVFG